MCMAEEVKPVSIPADLYGRLPYWMKSEEYLGIRLPPTDKLAEDRHDLQRERELNNLKESVLILVRYWMEIISKRLQDFDNRLKKLEDDPLDSEDDDTITIERVDKSKSTVASSNTEQ